MVSNKSVPDYVEDAAEVFNRDGFLIAKGLYYSGRDAGLEGAYCRHPGGGRSISARTRRLPASTYSCRRRWTPFSGNG